LKARQKVSKWDSSLAIRLPTARVEVLERQALRSKSMFGISESWPLYETDVESVLPGA